MRRLLIFSLATIALLAIGASPAIAAKGKKAKSFTYEITVENLTKTQPLSPPLAVIHKANKAVWKKGHIASHGVAAIAEDANNSILESALPRARGFLSAETVAQAPILPGESAFFEVTTKGRYNRLSLLAMLVKTNDAFSGLNAISLHRVKDKRVFKRMAFDAGSEENNQLATHIPGLGNPMVRAPEGDVIRKHPGIKDGVGDLTVASEGLSGPVIKVTVKRLAKN